MIFLMSCLLDCWSFWGPGKRVKNEKSHSFEIEALKFFMESMVNKTDPMQLWHSLVWGKSSRLPLMLIHSSLSIIIQVGEELPTWEFFKPDVVFICCQSILLIRHSPSPWMKVVGNFLRRSAWCVFHGVSQVFDSVFWMILWWCVMCVVFFSCGILALQWFYASSDFGRFLPDSCQQLNRGCSFAPWLLAIWNKEACTTAATTAINIIVGVIIVSIITIIVTLILIIIIDNHDHDHS